MKLSVNIDSENEAICSPLSAALALRVIATKIESGKTDGKIMDDNGNSVGTWWLEESVPDEHDEQDVERDDDGNPIQDYDDYVPATGHAEDADEQSARDAYNDYVNEAGDGSVSYEDFREGKR